MDLQVPKGLPVLEVNQVPSDLKELLVLKVQLDFKGKPVRPGLKVPPDLREKPEAKGLRVRLVPRG